MLIQAGRSLDYKIPVKDRAPQHLSSSVPEVQFSTPVCWNTGFDYLGSFVFGFLLLLGFVCVFNKNIYSIRTVS